MALHYFRDGSVTGTGTPIPALKAAAMSAAAPARADVAVLVHEAADNKKAARQAFHKRVQGRVAKGATTREAVSEESKTDPTAALDYLNRPVDDVERPIVRPNPTAFAQRVREVAQEKGIAHRDAIRVVSLSDPLAAREYESGASLREVERPVSRPTTTPEPSPLLTAARTLAQERRLHLRDALKIISSERKDLVAGYCGAFHLMGH
jgi:hypothetical protein